MRCLVQADLIFDSTNPKMQQPGVARVMFDDSEDNKSV